MTEPSSNPSSGDWVSGRRRFDQVAYDWLGVKDKLAGKVWLSTWVKHIYHRERTPEQAWHKIFKWIAVDAAMGYWLEQKYPKFMELHKLTGKRMWPLYATYLYGKNAASFNTLFLTAVDTTAREYVLAQVRYHEAVSKGEIPPLLS